MNPIIQVLPRFASVAGLRLPIALMCTVVLASAAEKRKARPAGESAANKGAAVSREVLGAYQALTFQGMPYRFLLPAGYDPAKQYPLILSLHGRAGVGDDNASQMRRWTATFVDAAWRAKYPCIVIAPQARDSWNTDGQHAPVLTEKVLAGLSETWRKRLRERAVDGTPTVDGPLTKAFALVDKICAEYAVDRNRIYVLGHSMGGFGSWNAIWSAPERFAAAIPSAGGLPPWQDYARFKNVPTWTFHGSADPTVPVEYTREIFARIRELGGNLKFTELKNVNHNAERYAFAYEGDDAAKGFVTRYSSEKCDRTPNVWDWLFKQRLDAR
jgi:predicted peptidase